MEFVGAATREREVLEPDGTSPAALVFELTRRTGTGVVGTVEVCVCKLSCSQLQ